MFRAHVLEELVQYCAKPHPAMGRTIVRIIAAAAVAAGAASACALAALVGPILAAVTARPHLPSPLRIWAPWRSPAPGHESADVSAVN